MKPIVEFLLSFLPVRFRLCVLDILEKYFHERLLDQCSICLSLACPVPPLLLFETEGKYSAKSPSRWEFLRYARSFERDISRGTRIDTIPALFLRDPAICFSSLASGLREDTIKFEVSYVAEIYRLAARSDSVHKSSGFIIFPYRCESIESKLYKAILKPIWTCATLGHSLRFKHRNNLKIPKQISQNNR